MERKHQRELSNIDRIIQKAQSVVADLEAQSLLAGLRAKYPETEAIQHRIFAKYFKTAADEIDGATKKLIANLKSGVIENPAAPFE